MPSNRSRRSVANAVVSIIGPIADRQVVVVRRRQPQSSSSQMPSASAAVVVTAEHRPGHPVGCHKPMKRRQCGAGWRDWQVILADPAVAVCPKSMLDRHKPMSHRVIRQVWNQSRKNAALMPSIPARIERAAERTRFTVKFASSLPPSLMRSVHPASGQAPCCLKLVSLRQRRVSNTRTATVVNSSTSWHIRRSCKQSCPSTATSNRHIAVAAQSRTHTRPGRRAGCRRSRSRLLGCQYIRSRKSRRVRCRSRSHQARQRSRLRHHRCHPHRRQRTVATTHPGHRAGCHRSRSHLLGCWRIRSRRWRQVHCKCRSIKLADTVVDVIADAIRIGVSGAVTTTHANGVELVARIHLHLGCQNIRSRKSRLVRCKCLIQLSRTSAISIAVQLQA